MARAASGNRGLGTNRYHPLYTRAPGAGDDTIEVVREMREVKVAMAVYEHERILTQLDGGLASLPFRRKRAS